MTEIKAHRAVRQIIDVQSIKLYLIMAKRLDSECSEQEWKHAEDQLINDMTIPEQMKAHPKQYMELLQSATTVVSMS
jgi:hypothetical protein